MGSITHGNILHLYNQVTFAGDRQVWVHRAKGGNAIHSAALQITMGCTYLAVVLMVLSLLWLCSLLTFSAEEHT